MFMLGVWNGVGISSGILYGMRKTDFPMVHENVPFCEDGYEGAVKLTVLRDC
jgi:hypothetical protein